MTSTFHKFFCILYLISDNRGSMRIRNHTLHHRWVWEAPRRCTLNCWRKSTKGTWVCCKSDAIALSFCWSKRNISVTTFFYETLPRPVEMSVDHLATLSWTNQPSVERVLTMHRECGVINLETKNRSFLLKYSTYISCSEPMHETRVSSCQRTSIASS